MNQPISKRTLYRAFHTTNLQLATAAALPTAIAAPPSPPAPPSKSHRFQRKGRFYQHVHIHEQIASSNTPYPHYTISLDARLLRHPATRVPLTIPTSKPVLATTLAAEWESLRRTKDAGRPHLLPLTGLVGRAGEIEREDWAQLSSRNVKNTESTTDGYNSEVSSNSIGPVRDSIIRSAMRHFRTDSLLCFAPSDTSLALRTQQENVARTILAPLTARTWAGVRLRGALNEDGGIGVRGQEEETRVVVEAWLRGLRAWELAALEVAVGAGRSLCVAARLLMEWGAGWESTAGEDHLEEIDGLPMDQGRFGIEEAARAAALEVDWQTGVWGLVEDSHDVDNEDMRRLFGSAVLVMAGEERI